MKMVWSLISLVAVTILLIASGLVGYLTVSGRLNGESAGVIASVLRGEKLVPAGLAEAGSATTQPTTQAAATQPALDLAAGELGSAMLDRQKRIVEDLWARLRDAQHQLIRDREEFAKKETLFEKRVEAQEKSDKDEGFSKALVMYTEMEPRQAKEDFMKLDLEIVVRYLAKMPKRTQKNILEEFRTVPEQEKRRQITERIRTQEIALKE